TAPTTIVPAETAQPRDRVARHIRDAADSTGVPFDYLLAQANQESRLNPDAKSRRSSAMGLYQFTKGTWLDMVKKHGAEHGLERYADAIATGKDGKPMVADAAMRREILELRRDPKVSALMAAEYAKENEAVLEARLGRQVSSHDLYLAHFLGASGAARVLEGVEDSPRHSAAGALPDAARANPEVFREPGSSRPRSFASLYKAVKARFANATESVAHMAQRARPEMDLAALKPPPRPEVAPDPGPQLAMADPAEVPVTDTALLPPAPPPYAAFANAMEPDTPFFPAALPPATSSGGLRAGGPVLRLMIEDMGGKA
ncbi:MAG TPA: transglycosylase SLT domain-containing protein, partial [Candidatus Omnitrophota bacterium]|nr:transglycosylase SLT domain-containing protein [Candidatus Omnitrophota bacterium]